MIDSILFVDAQALQARPGGAPSPQILVRELSNTMHGLTRELRQLNAYCAPSIDLTTRCAYRDAGFHIIDTAGSEETIVRTTMDLIGSLGGEQSFEEVILLGRSNFTPLIHVLKANKILISVSDRPDLPPSIEALADGLIDIDEIIQAGLAAKATPAGMTAPAAPKAKLASKPSVGAVSTVSASAPALQLVSALAAEAKADQPVVMPKTTELAAANEEDAVSTTENAAVTDDFEAELEADIVAFVEADHAKSDDADQAGDQRDPAPEEKTKIERPVVETQAPITTEAVDSPKASDQKTDDVEESTEDDGVDALLTQLMSDGFANDLQSNKGALDVVPER